MDLESLRREYMKDGLRREDLLEDLEKLEDLLEERLEKLEE